MNQESVLNTNNNKTNITNITTGEYNKEYGENLIKSTKETNPLNNVRISEFASTETENYGSDKIYIDTDEVNQYSEQLRTINQEIADEFEKVNRVMLGLENEWEASSCINAMSSFSILKEQLNSRKTQMSNYVSLINQVITSGYETTETDNTTLADAFK